MDQGVWWMTDAPASIIHHTSWTCQCDVAPTGASVAASAAARANSSSIVFISADSRFDCHHDQATARAATTNAAMPYRQPSWSVPLAMLNLITSGSTSRLTMFMTLISGLIAGPAVSLSGSPTVSPVTLAL